MPKSSPKAAVLATAASTTGGGGIDSAVDGASSGIEGMVGTDGVTGACVRCSASIWHRTDGIGLRLLATSAAGGGGVTATGGGVGTTGAACDF